MKKPLVIFKEQVSLDIREKKIYYVYNHDESIFLGKIISLHIGRFFHWSFCPENETYYTNGCLKEIVEFISLLYIKDKKEWQLNKLKK